MQETGEGCGEEEKKQVMKERERERDEVWM